MTFLTFPRSLIFEVVVTTSFYFDSRGVLNRNLLSDCVCLGTAIKFMDTYSAINIII